jgi:signal peptide peptidase SppA
MKEQFRFALLEFLQDQAWAISEPVLDQIFHVLHAKYFGDGINIAEVEAAMGRELKNTYDVRTRSNVAILPVQGIIGKRMNLITRYSGGVSTDLLRRDIEAAINNPEIDAIVLDVDSPGGTVAGTKELADYIYGARGQKPIVAHANENALSAAYWIASAADKVYASETANIGSIGVYTRHYDFSQYLENTGIKPTYIYAGKYKTMGNPDEPLKGRERNIIQSDIDALYTMFVDSVARNRGIDKSVVMQDALALLAEPALKRGLIDGIMTFDEAVLQAAAMASEWQEERQRSQYHGRIEAVGAKLGRLITQYASK